jgi:hypothetical protein
MVGDSPEVMEKRLVQGFLVSSLNARQLEVIALAGCAFFLKYSPALFTETKETCVLSYGSQTGNGQLYR